MIKEQDKSNWSTQTQKEKALQIQSNKSIAKILFQ